MIDTNTVNFAMNKLTFAIGSALPTVKNISAAYVHFVVSQQIVYWFGFLMGLLLTGIPWYFIYRGAKKKGDFDSGVFIAGTFVLGFAFLLLIIGFICQTTNAALAISNPEMFTVHQIIENAKGN
jgi:hypothetical protein